MTLYHGKLAQGFDRCPQCGIAKPLISAVWGPNFEETAIADTYQVWGLYKCSSCERLILAEGYAAPLLQGSSQEIHQEIFRLYPSPKTVDASLPPEAQRYLKQAYDTRFAPDASIVMAASAVDAMLKEKGYASGSLYSRIDKAVADHVLTEGMGRWAHNVRLEANAVRHADSAEPPTTQQAEQAVEFAAALGDFLFVFTARIDEGVRVSETG